MTIGAYGSGYSKAMLKYDRVGDFFQEWASAKNFFSGLPIYTSQHETASRYLNYTHSSQRVFVNVNAHPPASVLMTLPFGLLGYRRAFLLWNLLSLGLVIATGWLMAREPWRRGRYLALWPMVALFGSPLFQHIAMGQLTIWVLFLLVGVYRADQSDRPWRAGAWLGTAMALKLFPAFLLLYFFAKRKWSALAAAAVSFAFWNLAALTVIGPTAFHDYVTQSIPEVLSYCDWWGNQSLISFWFKLFAGWSDQMAPLIFSPMTAWVGSAVSVIAVVLVVAWIAWREKQQASAVSFSVAISAMLLVSPICWGHYLLLLMIPLLVLDARLPNRGPVRWCFNAALVAIWLNPEGLWFTWVQGRASPGQVVFALSWQFYALLATFALGVAIALVDARGALREECWSERVADRCSVFFNRHLGWLSVLLFGAPTRSPSSVATISNELARWRLWMYLTPNGWSLSIATAGIAAELLLLAQRSDNVYQFGLAWSLQIAFSIAWLWIGGVWIAWLGARAIAHVSRRYSRLLRAACYAGCGMTFVSLAAAYLASWGMYLQAGSFANIEAIEFIAENWRESLLAKYLLRNETRGLLILLACVAALATAGPWLMRRFARGDWAARLGNSQHLALRRWFAWIVLIVFPLTTGELKPADPTYSRVVLRQEGMANQLNPLLTLVFSGLRTFSAEPIEKVIDENELTRLHVAAPPAPQAAAQPSIIFVAVESLRHDVVGLVHQGKEVTPSLNALARGGVQWTRAYSQSTHSDYADVCIVSSMYPLRSRRHHYYRADEPWPKTCIYDRLKPAGYATAIISSQNENWGRMAQFLQTPNLDLFYDAERSQLPTMFNKLDGGFANEIIHGDLHAGKLDDAHTADVAIRWITEQARQDRPFFLSMNLQSSHFPYDLPPGIAKPFQPGEIDFPASFAYYPPEKTDIVRNAYYNALQYSDGQIGRIVETLRALDRLDNTILVVMGENGEAFHENGCVTHAGLPMEPTLRVACVMYAPQLLQPKVDDYPLELVDVSPSVLGLINWPNHPNFQGINAFAAARPVAHERLLFFHVENPLVHADAVLLAGRWKFIRNRATQQESLYDVVADPGERRNLLSEPDCVDLGRLMHDTWSRWRGRQLAYYYYPAYYQRYYPPRPPTIDAQELLSRLPQERLAVEARGSP